MLHCVILQCNISVYLRNITCCVRHRRSTAINAYLNLVASTVMPAVKKFQSTMLNQNSERVNFGIRISIWLTSAPDVKKTWLFCSYLRPRRWQSLRTITSLLPQFAFLLFELLALLHELRPLLFRHQGRIFVMITIASLFKAICTRALFWFVARGLAV